MALNIQLKAPIPVSRIRISPNYLSGTEIGQIIIETENTSLSSSSGIPFHKKAILNSVISLDKNNDIDLDSTYMIKGICIVFVQRNYTRTKINPVQSEINSKMISQILKEIKESRKESHDTLQDFVIRFFLRDTEKTFLLRNKKIYSYNYTSYYPKNLSKTNFGVVEKLSKDNFFSDIDAFNKLKNTSLISNIVFSIISYAIGSKLRNQISSTYIESNIRDIQKPLSSFRSDGMLPVGDSNIVDKNIHFFEQNFLSLDKSEVTTMLNSSEESNYYEYILSINNLTLFTKQIKNQVVQQKSVFVSKKIATNGKPLKTKMLADYFEELVYANTDVSKDKTSIEFSVSIVDYPISESDWQPILPYNDTSIRSEVLFLDSSGEGSLRFDPLVESVVLYENSIKRAFNTYSLSGKKIKVSQFNPTSRYFVSYSLAYPNVAKEVVHSPSSLASPFILSASTNGLNGEYYPSAGQDNRVRLSNAPYVDFSKLQNASYSIYTGTVTSSNTSSGTYDFSSYSPVKVVFEDGTTAINITNYIIDNNQIESFYDSENVLFIHTNDVILFNTNITKPFRVLYQYVPSSFRYRVIMRSLTSDDQNYTVDRLIFKFSTENKDNLLINLMKYDNLFKNKVN